MLVNIPYTEHLENVYYCVYSSVNSVIYLVVYVGG